jgi:hypothetical protein
LSSSSNSVSALASICIFSEFEPMIITIKATNKSTSLECFKIIYRFFDYRNIHMRE